MKTIKYLSLIVLAASLFGTSCIKDDAPALGDRGSAFVKFSQAPENDVYLTVSSSVDTISLTSLRREETSQASNDQTLTVTLMNDTAAITAYNDSNGTAYESMPDSIYTFVGSTITKNGNAFTVTIPGGTIGNEMYIALNSAKWDISHKYAFYFKITDSAGHKIRTGLSEVLVTIQAKNEFDADYQVTGWFFHPTAGRAINTVKHLTTVTINSVEGGLGDLSSVFDFEINKEDNSVTWLMGPYTGTAGSNGFMTSDNPASVDYSSSTNEGHVPGDADFNSTIYNNTYDPATQTFYLHYGYNAADPSGESVFTRQIYEKWVRIN